MKVYYEDDIDRQWIDGKKVAVIGYGSQGSAHANNLRDSGVDVAVGLSPNSASAAKVRATGIQVMDMAAAAAWADVVMVLVPDHLQAEIYQRDLKPGLAPGNSLMFAHGFNIHFGLIETHADVDITMVAPKAPGHTVRRQYELGHGVPCLVAVANDPSGRGKNLALAYAAAIGGARAGVIETNFREETERAVPCGMRGVGLYRLTALSSLQGSGYTPSTMTYQGFLQRHSQSPDAVVAAVADNCRFDERAGIGRWQRFDSLLRDEAANLSAMDWKDWNATNKRHRDRYCKVHRPCVPDAFLEINRCAWLQDLPANQSLVRIEDLTRPLIRSSRLDNLDHLKDLLQGADNGNDDARRAVQDFFDEWNQDRDARPAFAAFYDQVQQEADGSDWPHALRDRLGLGHYCGATLPVALMRYPFAEVFSARASRQLPVACAVPTVLDDGMHQFFFPAPRERSSGATVHLAPKRAGTITAEILHCRIDYRREHLWKIDYIKRPRKLTDDQLREARDWHLLALQEECDRGDFGEFRT